MLVVEDLTGTNPPSPALRVANIESALLTRLRRALVWFLIVAGVIGAAWAGVRLRQFVWDSTDHIRFFYDIQRGCFWGLECSGPEGYLNQYEKMQVQTRDWNLFLDYVPLRLAVMWHWGAYLRSHFPEVNGKPPYETWERSYAFNATVIHFNMCMDALAAVCAFLLTYHWVHRGRGPLSPHFCGVPAGLAAAALVWFNPAMLISAYGWPTWDAWVVPMYLLTVLLASWDLWFCAGVAFAIAAMLKGQQFAIAPIFVFWTLFLGRPAALLRFVIGATIGVALVGGPWLLTYIPAEALAHARATQQALIAARIPPSDYPADLFALRRTVDWPAMIWIAGSLLTIGVAACASWQARADLALALNDRRRAAKKRSILLACGAAIALATVWPWFLPRNHGAFPVGAALSILLAIATLLVRPRFLPYLMAGVLGVSLLLCMSLFHGSRSWWDVGVGYGADHYEWIEGGVTDNLGGVLHERYRWPQDPRVHAMTLPQIGQHWPAWIASRRWWPAAPLDLSIKQVMGAIYAFFLSLSGVAIGLQARRNNRRMLLALITPWLVFFCFPAEVQPRYLLFAAGVGAIAVGESLGMALLMGVITIISWIMTYNALLLAATGLTDAGTHLRQLSAYGQYLAQRWPGWFSQRSGWQIFHALDRTHPDLTWSVMLVTAIILFQALNCRRNERLTPRLLHRRPT